MNKRVFFKRLAYERDHFELLLNRVGFLRRMTIMGASGNLSVKDLLADILTRGQFLGDRLTEILHGASYAPSTSHTLLETFRARYGFPDYESPLFNRAEPDHLVMLKFRNIDLDEIVSQELGAYENILTIFERLPLTQILDHDLYHRVAEHTIRPYRRVSFSIRRWMKSIAIEL